jgi:hypothetical protein
MDPDMGTIFFLGSNRNKPKLNLFRFCLGLFHETKKNSVCFGVSEPFENEPKQKSAFRNKSKLKTNTLLCNGHRRGNGYEHGHGHGLGHFSFVSVCFERSLGGSVISK